MPADAAPITRRAALAGLATGTASLSGCLGQIWSAWERDSPSQITLEILTPPEDDDMHALRIARHLADNMERVGIQTDVAPTRIDTFLREVLINHNFDMYVWNHPAQRDPDALRKLLHSQFAEERGWQNPYGFSNTIIDQLLEDQLFAEDSATRLEHLSELQNVLIDERPFIPVAFAEDQRIIRTDRVSAVGDAPFHDSRWLYELRGTDDTDGSLTLGITDARLTRNLNPIAVEYRGYHGIMELLYCAPAKSGNDGYIPWLAEDWEWVSPANATVPTLELTLRDDLAWHDGEALTSEDVAFTYEFLRDTSMTADDPRIPSPMFRGRGSLVDSVEAVDEHAVRIQFVQSTRDVARQLLTVPILPAHVWEEWTGPTEVAGIAVDDVTTEALIQDNLDPVGSGPYRVSDIQTDDLLRLERVEDHLFVDAAGENHPVPEVGPPEPSELVFEIRPSASNIIDAVRDGGLDGSLASLPPDLVDDARDETNITDMTQITSRLFHIGFNVREGAALTHAGFRTGIEPLLDRVYIEEEVFQGASRLTQTGVYDAAMVPSDLRWNEGDTDRFAGDPGTGEVDPEQGRVAFRESGFSFSEDGNLLVS